jgi:hypothetical protein
VAYVPYELIVGCIIDVMQRHGKLHHAQTGSKMPSVNAYNVNDVLPQLVSKRLKLVTCECFEVCRGIDLL